MSRRIFSPEEVTRKVTTFRQNRAKPDNASQFVSVFVSADFSSRNRFSEGENPRTPEIRKTGICFSKTLYRVADADARLTHNLANPPASDLKATRGRKAHNLASWACRQSVKPVLLTAQPWLSPAPRTGGKDSRAERPFARLYAMQALTPLRSKENSPKFLPACRLGAPS